MEYKPFDKPLHEVTAADLIALGEVAEGWYVEYKREVSNARTIAKSVAAFANHHGGWIFYGVAQSTQGKNTADSFPGLPVRDLDRVAKRIRDAVAAHIQPSPHFDIKSIEGPCADIGLTEDRCILIVTVPMGLLPPYVHSSGRIYRRIGDGSDPVEETSRRALDLLWDRTKETRRRFEDLVTSEPELSKAETELSILSIFLFPNVGAPPQRSALNFGGFADLMTDSKGHWILRFDNCFSSARGFVARQVTMNDPDRLVFTFSHRTDGTTIVRIPLRSFEIASVRSRDLLEPYEYGREFLDRASEAGHGESIAIDLNSTLFLLAGCLQKHRALLDLGDLRNDYRCKLRLDEAWRRVPFVDNAGYLDYVSSYGFPIIQESSVLVPTGLDPANTYRVRWDDDKQIGPMPSVSIGPWVGLSRACGLGGWEPSADMDGFAQMMDRVVRIMSEKPPPSSSS